MANHEVATVAYQGWRGVVNGALLDLVEQSGFEVFLTADKNMEAQQKLSGRKFAVVVLSANRFQVHRARIASIALAIDNCAPGNVTFVNLNQGEPSRSL